MLLNLLRLKIFKTFLAQFSGEVILYVEAERMTNREKEDFWAEVEGGFFLFAFVLAPILTILILLARVSA